MKIIYFSQDNLFSNNENGMNLLSQENQGKNIKKSKITKSIDGKRDDENTYACKNE